MVLDNPKPSAEEYVRVARLYWHCAVSLGQEGGQQGGLTDEFVKGMEDALQDPKLLRDKRGAYMVFRDMREMLSYAPKGVITKANEIIRGELGPGSRYIIKERP